jgi:hypothetical protein
MPFIAGEKKTTIVLVDEKRLSTPALQSDVTAQALGSA